MHLFSWLSRFWVSVSKLKIIFFFIGSGADYFLLRRPVFHNGTESRDLLPLRKGTRRTMPLRKATATQRHRIAGSAAVAEGNAKDNAAQKGYSEGNGDMRLPQRHRIAGSAAVAEEESKDNAAQKGYSEGNGDMRLPQRHRFAGFAAAAEGLSIFADEYGTERRDTREYNTA